MKWHTVRMTLAALALAVGIPAAAAAADGSLLDTVKARGQLICGVSGELPGFSYREGDAYKGFDVDYCKAVAAAVLGDAGKVKYVPLQAAQRPTALQSGEIDVLIRNTTWTLTRDTDWGADFAPTTFYDGQGFMVKKDLGVSQLEDLNGASICVQSGTTTELNLADTFKAMGLDYTPVVFADADTTYNAFVSGRCDAVTSDKSQLAAKRSAFKSPGDYAILDATISKEPLGPVTIQGDSKWHDVVSWVVFATLFADEHDITSQNIGTFANTKNPEIARFLGQDGDLGAKLGLDAGWAKNVILAVGNYSEIYDRDIKPLGIPRGPNQAWTSGGLLYSPPFR